MPPTSTNKINSGDVNANKVITIVSIIFLKD
jgi:hypothetical protein